MSWLRYGVDGILGFFVALAGGVGGMLGSKLNPDGNGQMGGSKLNPDG